MLCREALRAHLVTQSGIPDRINDTSVTKRQVNSALSAMRPNTFFKYMKNIKKMKSKILKAFGCTLAIFSLFCNSRATVKTTQGSYEADLVGSDANFVYIKSGAEVKIGRAHV